MRYNCTRNISKVSHTNLLVPKTFFFNPFRTSIIKVVHCFLKFQVILYILLKVYFNPFFHTGYIMVISHLSTSLELSSFCELHFVICIGGQEQPGSCKNCGLGVLSYLRIFIILPITVQPLCRCRLLRQIQSFVVFLVFKTKNWSATCTSGSQFLLCAILKC